MRPRLFFCDHYEIPLPPGHKFPIRKYRLLRDRLDALGRFEIAAAGLAPLDRILLVHDPDYVSRFVSGTLDAQVMRRIGFPWSESMMRRTLASVGGTLLAAQDAMDRGLGAVLAGGTHHAFPSYGAGFCVFNDIAVAIASLRLDGRIRRAAVVDLDVHQGDGTAAIFSGDPEVLTLSLHGRNNFPFRKQTSRIDLAFEDGTGDEEYLKALAEVLPEVARFEPDIVFYQSGVDALEHDTLGKLRLTFEGLQERDRMVFDLCRGEGFPVAVTMGGGYSNPIEWTVRAHAQTYEQAGELLG